MTSQVCFAVGKQNEVDGHAFAISIDDKGEPSLQLCRSGKEAVILDGDKLTALFGK
jgi:hypothetical protein